MRLQEPILLQMQDPRGISQACIDSLRAVLEKPAALVISSVIAADESLQSGVLDRLLPQKPFTAPTQAEPTVECRHIRPFGHGPQYQFVHARCSLKNALLSLQQRVVQTSEQSRIVLDLGELIEIEITASE